jgi:antirestriction protein ArdC
MSESTKPTVKEKLTELTAGIEKGIQELFQSDRYAEYLRTMSRFHRYSLNNTMLIYLQKPDATLVAGFNKWRDQFSRNVQRGEKGIRIIAPMPRKKTIETQRIDPATREPLLDHDGNPLVDQKEITVPFFRPVTVFDVSQTKGKPLPEIVSDLTGSVEQYEVFMEALKRTSPVPMEMGNVPPHVDGIFSESNNRIVLREGMSQVQTVSTAVHELTHAKLHTKAQLAIDQRDESALHKDRGTHEVEAESVAYAVCAYYGIATEENSFGYIATWSKDKELTTLKESLETINRTASKIITDIDRNINEIRKERGLDVEVVPEETMSPSNSLQPEQVLSSPAEEVPAPDPIMTPEVLPSFGYTDQDMHPLSRERTVELFERGLPVHLLGESNAQTLATRMEDIMSHTGICGITKTDWQAASLPESREAKSRDAEQLFKDSQEDVFLIYQMRSGDELRDIRFQPYQQVKDTLSPQHYDAVHSGKMPQAKDTQAVLNQLYIRFNEAKPWDSAMRSLSTGDVIALKQSGQITCHYVDTWGFVELPGFFSGRNPTRTLEDMLEQNDNQLDGLLNNMPTPKQAEQKQPDMRKTEIRQAQQERGSAKETPRKSVLAQIRQTSHSDAAGRYQRPDIQR